MSSANITLAHCDAVGRGHPCHQQSLLSQIDIKGMKRYGYGGQSGAYSQYGRKYYVN